MKTGKSALWISGLLAVSLWGAPAHSESLSLSLAKMWQQNPSLAAARSNFKAIYKSQFVTLAEMLPTVTGYAQEVRINENIRNAQTGLRAVPDADVQDFDSYGVEMRYNIFTSGKNLFAFRSKRAEIDAERSGLRNTEQSIMLQGISAFLDVLQARATLDLRQSNIKVLQEQVDAVRDRFEVGVVTRTDIAQSEARLAGAKSSALLAEANLRGAEAVFEEVFGYRPAGLNKPVNLPAMPPSLQSALDVARVESPILKQAQHMARSGKFTSYSTLGSALPSVTITGSYDVKDGLPSNPAFESEGSTIAARLSVPLFRGGRSLAAISGATDYNDALRRQVHSASRALERGVVVAWNNFRASESAINAREEQIQASQLALEGVRQENTLGTRTNIDLLDAEQELLNAQVGLVEAERNHQLAAYSLLASIGQLTPQRLRLPRDLPKTEE